MMKRIQFLLSITMMVFLTSGCGEGFRATELASSDGGQDSAFFDSEGNRRSFTDLDVDREILMSYSSELDNKEDATTRLGFIIRAFDMILSTDSNNNFNFQARLALGCNDAEFFDVAVTQQQMQTMQVINMGRQGDYEVEFRCTTGGCDELVAGIRKFKGNDQGLVLTGLAVGGQREGEILYVSRSVDFAPYFAAFDRIQNFEQQNSCSITPAEEERSWKEQLTDRLAEEATDRLKDWFNNL